MWYVTYHTYVSAEAGVRSQKSSEEAKKRNFLTLVQLLLQSKQLHVNIREVIQSILTHY